MSYTSIAIVNTFQLLVGGASLTKNVRYYKNLKRYSKNLVRTSHYFITVSYKRFGTVWYDCYKKII